MNKNLLILPAMVFTMGLASCAKSITKDEALKFVKENYTKTEGKKPKSGTEKWNFSGCKGDAAKEIVKSYFGLSELSGSKALEYLPEFKPVTENDITSLSGDVKFSVKGKELTITQSVKQGDLGASESSTCNSDGYPISIKLSFDAYKIDESNTFVGNFEYLYNY